FTLTAPPSPSWCPPENQPLPKPFSADKETVFKASDLEPGEMYRFLIGAVVPRPVALVSTCSKEKDGGPVNMAPFSYYMLVCHDPPTIMVSINYSRGKPKDSLRNIEETGEFVVNSFNEHFVESGNHCAIPVPYDVEEDQLSGLTLVPSRFVRPKRCLESLISFECKFTHCHKIKNDAGDIATGVVFGEIVGVTIKNEVWNPETKVVDMALFKPVSRLGGNMYGRTTSGYEISRP
ncbi:flavoprotein oxygenase, partial [Obelidium mucronatum]